MTYKGWLYIVVFAYIDYKVQGRTLDRVVLKLQGTKIININNKAVFT